MTVYDPPASAARTLSVRALLDDRSFDLTASVLAGVAGLERKISHPRVQKSGLALVGHLHGVVPTRIQVLGETELSYVESLDGAERVAAASHFFSPGLTCVIVTRGITPPRALIDEAERTDTPLVLVQERSSSAITALHTLLDERLAPRARIHGVLVDVFEVGVLILGKSGIGKSECGLELVMNGHRLVADDAIEADFRPPGMVFGEPAELLRHHIEVRGLGVLNIKDLYGVTAIRERKRIDLVVQLELESENAEAEYDRLGLDDDHSEILGVPIRRVTLPVRPGRNMSSIIEIAARRELLRQAGADPARAFLERVEEHAREQDPRGRATNESALPPPVGGTRRT